MKNEKYVVYNLQDVYPQLGEFEFKIVLNGFFFKNARNSEVTIVDSDGKQMKFSYEVWGRKINCKFMIDNDVADGVSSVLVRVKDEEFRLIFWVIKP
jgi:hypothetical protein